jgi:transcription antitermination factor NusG
MDDYKMRNLGIFSKKLTGEVSPRQDDHTVLSSQQWYALYIKSRHEFVTQNELLQKEIVTYLPTFRLRRQWKDREKCVVFPIFPGYLFVCVEPVPEQFLNVLKTRGAVSFVSMEPGSPTPVPFEEINSLRIMIESGEEFDIYPHLKEGTLLRVKNGPLRGAEGTLVKKENGYLFFVHIELFGRSVGVRMYAEDLEAA